MKLSERSIHLVSYSEMSFQPMLRKQWMFRTDPRADKIPSCHTGATSFT
jgi:hypothetical protein